MKYGALFSVSEEEKTLTGIIVLKDGYMFEKGPHHPENDAFCPITVGSNQMLCPVEFRYALVPKAQPVDETAVDEPDERIAEQVFKENHTDALMERSDVVFTGVYVEDTDVPIMGSLDDFMYGIVGGAELRTHGNNFYMLITDGPDAELSCDNCAAITDDELCGVLGMECTKKKGVWKLIK